MLSSTKKITSSILKTSNKSTLNFYYLKKRGAFKIVVATSGWWGATSAQIDFF